MPTTTTFLWDDDTDTVVMEKDETGTITAEYTHAPTQHGYLLSQHREGQTSHFHYDGNGNTRALTDDTQAVTDQYAFTAFGDEVATSGITKNRHRFGGRYGYQHNTLTGDLYVRERIYEPTKGRWLSKDPLRMSKELSPYLYAGNTPTMRVDPSGLIDCKGVDLTTAHGKKLLEEAQKTGDYSKYAKWQQCFGQAGVPSNWSSIVKKAPKPKPDPRGARKCYDHCAKDCYDRYQNVPWRRRLWSAYRACLHECARVCRKHFNLRPSKEPPAALAMLIPVAPASGRCGTVGRVKPGPAIAIGIGLGILWFARPVDEPIDFPLDLPRRPKRPRNPCQEHFINCSMTKLVTLTSRGRLGGNDPIAAKIRDRCSLCRDACTRAGGVWPRRLDWDKRLSCSYWLAAYQLRR